MTTLQDADYERFAQRLRLQAGVEDRFCPDLIYVLIELKRQGLLTNFRSIADDQMGDDHAFYDSDANSITTRASVWEALDSPLKAPKSDRRHARFVMAHELGHFALGHDGKLHRGATSRNAKRISLRAMSQETAASKFAGAFLMPARLASPSYTVEDLSDLFDVNSTPAAIRKSALEKMDRQAHGKQRPLPKSVQSYLDERRKGR